MQNYTPVASPTNSQVYQRESENAKIQSLIWLTETLLIL